MNYNKTYISSTVSYFRLFEIVHIRLLFQVLRWNWNMYYKFE